MMKKLITAIILFVAINIQAKQNISNPILAGYHADPEVISG